MERLRLQTSVLLPPPHPNRLVHHEQTRTDTEGREETQTQTLVCWSQQQLDAKEKHDQKREKCIPQQLSEVHPGEFLSSADVTLPPPSVTVMGTERALEPGTVSMPTGNVMPNLIRLQKTVFPIETPTRADCLTPGIH